MTRVSYPPEAKNKTSDGTRVPASAAATYHTLTSILPHSRCNQVKPYGREGRGWGCFVVVVVGGGGVTWPNRSVPSQDRAISHAEIPQRTTTYGQLPSWRWKTKARQSVNRDNSGLLYWDHWKRYLKP